MGKMLSQELVVEVAAAAKTERPRILLVLAVMELAEWLLFGGLRQQLQLVIQHKF
jgi:hypothetical protein